MREPTLPWDICVAMLLAGASFLTLVYMAATGELPWLG